jgi:DNA-binding NtrC family response regulator
MGDGVKPVRILLVDDEEGIRMTVGGNLELSGFEVVEAEDGSRALAVLEKDARFDLVLSDIRMPGMSGVELFHRIRARFPEVPVVLMTAFALEKEIGDAIAHGAFAVLSKPFDVGATLPTLRKASQRPYVLVVEGSEKDAFHVADALSSAGVRARGVVSGEAALGTIRSVPVDVCVADPEVRSGEAAAVTAIRSADPTIAIVVLADTVTPEVTAKLAGVRPAAFAENPIRPADLVALVASVRGKARR